MANSTYTSTDGAMHHFSSDGQTMQHLNNWYFLEPNTRWSMFPQPASSLMHRRHDSLAYPPSVALGLSGSNHQAESQPRRNTTTGISTATKYPGFPVNNYMTRSVSQYTSLPRTQPQYQYNIHRVSCDSFDSTLPSTRPNMARSYPERSESFGGVPQLHQVPSPLSPSTWHPSPSSSISQNVTRKKTFNVIKSPYEFDLYEIIGNGNGNASAEQYLGLETHANRNTVRIAPSPPKIHSLAKGYPTSTLHLNTLKFGLVDPSLSSKIGLPLDITKRTGSEPHWRFSTGMYERPTSLFPSWSTNVTPSTESSNHHLHGEQSTSVVPNFNRRDVSPDVGPCHSPSGSSTVTPSPSATPVPRTSAQEAAEDDCIVGQVTLSGRFTCLHKACRDDETLTFNRHADFKRHYANMHGKRVIEYFCSEQGCQRSKNPADGKKGRSFKGRRDKMKEHMETVHSKYESKRKRDRESEDHEEDDRLDCESGYDKPRYRRQGRYV